MPDHLMRTKKSKRDSRFIETEAIIVAYAMSRLNERFLARFRFSSWRRAFAATGSALDVPATSMKNLRDEFDPLHGFRRGWHNRLLRPNRQRVLAEFCEVSDEALLEISERIFLRDNQVRNEVVQSIAFAKERIENVAERLRTGRRAEEFFLANTEQICGLSAMSMIDRRQDAVGFDFAVADRPELAIEVKGLKTRSGQVLFTDFEWRTARSVGKNYWLVVIGNLDANPGGKLWRNPTDCLQANAVLHHVAAVSWRARVSVQ